MCAPFLSLEGVPAPCNLVTATPSQQTTGDAASPRQGASAVSNKRSRSEELLPPRIVNQEAAVFLWESTAASSKDTHVSGPQNASGYTQREHDELKAFVQRHKLSKIESSLFENEITVEFLLSQSQEAAAENCR